MSACAARLVVLASGAGTNLQALIDACTRGELEATIGVVSDRPGSGALARAAAHGLEAVALPVQPDEPRREYDARLAGAVAARHPDLIVLAGWMRVLSRAFLDRATAKVINLHPALPGELPGIRAIERAWGEALAGARTHTGVMVHAVPDEGVDDGPVILAETLPIDTASGFERFAAAVHALEHRLLVAAVGAELTLQTTSQATGARDA